jgi:hypothetical protein
MKKKKTFKELFAGTGIEPTTNENGGVDYNFKATLTTQSKPQSLFVYVSTAHPSAIVNISTEYQNLSEKEKSELLSKLFEWIANKKAEIKPVKLYTEQQVIMAMHLTNTYKENYNQVLEQLTPIELPSDEEVLEECNKLPFEKHVDCGMYNDGQIDGFELGAKWMKEQILKNK